MAHPPIASDEDWLTQRKALLEQEKALTREYDRISAARRRLPMVPVAQDYRFTGIDARDAVVGEHTLRALFGDARQLIVYHFMFDPEWEKGCPGCTGYVDELGDLSLLAERDTRFVLVSRAPWPKLEAYRAQRGWDIPWFSSYGSRFNYDFHVTFDAAIAPIVSNYRTAAELEALGRTVSSGESAGLSVFFQLAERVFHTYSTYGRGVENRTDTYSLLDITPYGRQESFEDSPPGWPQRPTYG